MGFVKHLFITITYANFFYATFSEQMLILYSYEHLFPAHVC